MDAVHHDRADDDRVRAGDLVHRRVATSVRRALRRCAEAAVVARTVLPESRSLGTARDGPGDPPAVPGARRRQSHRTVDRSDRGSAVEPTNYFDVSASSAAAIGSPVSDSKNATRSALSCVVNVSGTISGSLVTPVTLPPPAA